MKKAFGFLCVLGILIFLVGCRQNPVTPSKVPITTETAVSTSTQTTNETAVSVSTQIINGTSVSAAVEGTSKATVPASDKTTTGFAVFVSIQVTNTTALIDGGIATVQGQSTAPSLKIDLDSVNIGTVKCFNGAFSYQVDITALSGGWHYIRFYDQASAAEDGVWVNKLDGPSVLVSKKDVDVANTARTQNYKSRYKQWWDDNYSPTGIYFGSYGQRSGASARVKFDDDQIPLVLYNGDEWIYNPTTIAQRALSYYRGDLKSGESDYDNFLKIARWLAGHQEENGSFPYAFAFTYYDITIPTNWVSGMAQGQLLSVYARAYGLTKDPYYLIKGQQCLNFMINDHHSAAGGCKVTIKDFTDLSPALKPYENDVLFDEYIFEPEPYVLNGNLFALIGLYDWASVATAAHGAADAQNAFSQGCQAIEVLLPYYDYHGYTAYDLLQYYPPAYGPNFTSTYAHDYHIVLLNSLAEITGNSVFRKYCDLFVSYSNAAN